MTRITDLFDGGNARGAPTLSFEFFPPKTVKATDRLLAEIEILDGAEPDFVSVTYGAGGTTRTRTGSLVCGLADTKPYPVMPHLTAIGHSAADIEVISRDYSTAGVENLLVLAGDPPADGQPAGGDFRFASELIEEVQGVADFCLGVAAFPEVHPRSTDRASDRDHLAAKLNKADFGITQFFFDATHYLDMVEELAALGCTTPVVPGVMPVVNTESIRRFAAMNGAAVPEELFARIDAAATDKERLDLAADHAAALVTDLIDGGAPGVHLYTLNRAQPALDVIERCGLR